MYVLVSRGATVFDDKIKFRLHVLIVLAVPRPLSYKLTMPPPKPWEVGTGNAPTSSHEPPALPIDSTPAAKQLVTQPQQTALSPTNAYNSGSALNGGLGMGGYGMSGMGGMGGYGMNGMGMGGYGMGGMGMGGYGMGGYGMGGYGMMGMMGMGMSEQEQRGQMAMMMLSRVADTAHAFTQVLQMMFGSVMNFAGSYMGLTTQYQQMILSEGTVDTEAEYKRLQQQRRAILAKRRETLRRAQQQHTTKSLFFSALRKAVLFLVALFLARRIMGLGRGAPPHVATPVLLH